MKTEALDDQQLVEQIRHASTVHQSLIDEYYSRCIPIYLEFIGIHWHTGYYLDDKLDVTPGDQTRMIRVVADSIKLKAQDHVLDVGCGIGSTACFLAQNYACQVRGLTPVLNQVQIARQLIQQAGVEKQVSIDSGVASELPYSDNSIDVVLFFESPCHFPDRMLFFKEAFRVLKPGGRLAGEDWLASSAPTKTERPNEYVQAICRNWAIPMLGDGPSYQLMMQSAGFEHIKYTDMRSEMALEKGFSVSRTQQKALLDEINHCRDPLLKLTLEGLLALGRALTADAFTIGRFTAFKSGAPTGL